MAMSRKDYVAIAAALHKSLDESTAWWLSHHVVPDLCEVFEADNPRFDRKQFTQAVGAW